MTALELKPFPELDPNVLYVRVSKLRELKVDKLRNLNKTLVIQDNETPLAVVLSYDQFLEMQNERKQILATLQTVLEKGERTSLEKALEEASNGHTKPISAIRKSLKETTKRQSN
jgi:hypothetical protein